MSASTAPISGLIVEDEWAARNYLVELLQESGRVEVAAAVATLDEAREALGPGGISVDVAFVDVQLAGTPGDQRPAVRAAVDATGSCHQYSRPVPIGGRQTWRQDASKRFPAARSLGIRRLLRCRLLCARILGFAGVVAVSVVGLGAGLFRGDSALGIALRLGRLLAFGVLSSGCSHDFAILAVLGFWRVLGHELPEQFGLFGRRRSLWNLAGFGHGRSTPRRHSDRRSRDCPSY